MFEIQDLTKDNLIAFKATGKIEEKDYEKLKALLEKTEREQQPVRLLIEIGEITGVTAKAMLKDIATYFKHVRKVEKVAVVGDHKAEKGWAKVADPFIKADIQYFPLAQKMNAESWITA